MGGWNSTWTPERTEKLTALSKEGLSAAEIARRLGGGVSRNSVLGKQHRLGLLNRPRPSAPTTRRNPTLNGHSSASTKAAQKARLKVFGNGMVQEEGEARPARDPVRVIKDPPGLATCLTLGPHMCKWPIGEPSDADFTFCGKRTERTYCEVHHKRAYQPISDKRKSPNQMARSLRRYI